MLNPVAHRRIKVAAASQEVDPGDIVSALALEHLPAVEGEGEPDEAENGEQNV